MNNRASEIRDIEFAGIFLMMPWNLDPPNLHENAHHVSFHRNHPIIRLYDCDAFKDRYLHTRFIPMFLNDLTRHLRSPDFPLDVTLLNLSP
jgi:hypothetical protein